MVVTEALGDVIEGCRPAGVRVDVFHQKSTRTATSEPRQRRSLYLLREGQVLGWPELSAMMTRIATHEDKGRRVGTSKAAHMPYRMPGAMEDIEAAVTKVIERWEAADQKRKILLRDLTYSTPCEVRVQHGGLLVRGVAGEVLLLETGADDQVGRGGERRHVPDVVPVVVAPDHGVNVLAGHTDCALVEDVGDILVNVDLEQWLVACDPGGDDGREIPVVFSDPDVEEDVLVLRLVFYQEAEAGELKVVMAWDVRAENELCWPFAMSCAVDDPNGTDIV